MPTSTFGFTKAPVSHHKTEDQSKLRRLASVTNLAKSFTRRQSSSNKENIPPVPALTYQDENTSTSRSRRPNMPPPCLITSRARRVSSPHPRKEILPRSITISNLPVSRPRLPSTHTSISLVGRTLTPSPASAAVVKRSIAQNSQVSDRRKSLIPTPTSRGLSSARLSSSNFVDPQPREEITEVNRTSDLSPSRSGDTSQKLKHKISKSPERKEPQEAPYKAAIAAAKLRDRRRNSTYDVVHHGLLKAISPPVLPPPQVDTLEGKRTSLAPIRSNRSINSSDENLEATNHPTLMKGSHQGLIAPLDPDSATRPNTTTDLEAQDFDGYIRRAEPSAYWTGRFVTLNDRFWMDSEDTPKPAVRGGAQIMQDREEQRARRVFDHLEKMCLTEPARKSLWQFRVLMASIRAMPTLLTGHTNIYINDIGTSRRESTSSPEYTRDQGSFDGTGMPKKACLPKGPEKIQIRPAWAPTSTSSPGSYGSYGSYQPAYKLVPPPLAIPDKTYIDFKSEQLKQPSPSTISKPHGKEITPIESMLEETMDEKATRRKSFVDKLIGKARRESSLNGSGVGLSNVYPGT